MTTPSFDPVSATEPNGTHQRQRRGCMLMVIGMAILLSSAAIIFFTRNTPLGCAPGLPVLFHSIAIIAWLLLIVGAYLEADATAGLWRLVKWAVFVGLFIYLVWPSFDCLTRQLLPRTAQLQVAPTEPPLTP